VGAEWHHAFTGVYSSPPPVGTPTRQAAIADALLGFPATYSVQTTPYEQRLRYSNFSTYVQDDWRTTTNLTVNIGLRWEYFGKPDDLFDRNASLTEYSAATGGTERRAEPHQSDRNNLTMVDSPGVRLAQSLVIRAYILQPPSNGAHADSRIRLHSWRPVPPPRQPHSPLPEFTADDPLAGANRQTNLTRSGVDRNRDACKQWNSVQKLVTANTLGSCHRGSRGCKPTSTTTK
jgi:hypothetical protein